MRAKKRSRESVNIEQGISTGEMLLALVLLGKSAQAYSVGD